MAITSLVEVGDACGGFVAVQHMRAFGHGGLLRGDGQCAGAARPWRDRWRARCARYRMPALPVSQRRYSVLSSATCSRSSAASSLYSSRSTEPAGACSPSRAEEVHRPLLEGDGDPEQVGRILGLAVDTGEDGRAVELEVLGRRRQLGVVALGQVSMCSFSIAGEAPEQLAQHGILRHRARRARRRRGRRVRSRRPCARPPSPGRPRSRRGRAARACPCSAGTCRRGRRNLR